MVTIRGSDPVEVAIAQALCQAAGAVLAGGNVVVLTPPGSAKYALYSLELLATIDIVVERTRAVESDRSLPTSAESLVALAAAVRALKWMRDAVSHAAAPAQYAVERPAGGPEPTP